MPDLDPLESVAASELVSASLLASLIPTLVNRGVLSPQDANDIYENALMMIEMQQGSDPTVQHVYEAARELIEAHLRPE
jgi:glycerol-3-phosphate O-acyltransferase